MANLIRHHGGLRKSTFMCLLKILASSILPQMLIENSDTTSSVNW